MTTEADIVNRALQLLGTRTTVTANELSNNETNEAIQANLVLHNLRDDLLRMAPWDCALKTANLVYITSIPGTPENPTAGTTLWERGQPSPPWAYEYQYPVDCLRACWIIPAWSTGFAGAVPIYPVTTGVTPSLYTGPPIRFKVQLDEFRPVTAAAVASGGSGYAVGDIITLAETPSGDPPIGAPVKLRVVTAPAGVVATVAVVTQVYDTPTASPLGGSYFGVQTNPVAQSSTDGSGSGATFNLTQGAKAPQRVVLTNQEFATLVYCQVVEDPNVMDTLFQSAWAAVLAATMTNVLTGDKDKANGLIKQANDAIIQARTADGNEGFTINDVTPDWIAARGYLGAGGPQFAFNFDWGDLWAPF